MYNSGNCVILMRAVLKELKKQTKEALYCANSTQLYYTTKSNMKLGQIIMKEEIKTKKQKQELILIISILAVSALLYVGSRIIFSKPPLEVEISVDGSVIQTLPLSEDTELTVEGWNGGTNHIVIRDGKVRVTEASCPDKVCVNQGTIERTGEAVICLPNRLIARIKGGE